MKRRDAVTILPFVPRAGGATAPRFELTPFEKVKLDLKEQYLIKSLFPSEGLAVIWGEPKCGKSFWTFDAVMHVALGRPYRGLRVKKGAVIYCALEGARGFARRVAAFRKEKVNGETPNAWLMTTPLDLVKDAKALVDDIRRQLGGQRPAIVIIDTLNRSMSGSESSDEDMAAYIRASDAIRAAFGCLVVVIHHCGHDKNRPRGHSSLMGAADVQISVKRDAAGNIVATVEYAKDGETGLVIVSRLKPVVVGTDEDDGEPITSCVVEPVEEATAGDEQRPQTRAWPKSLAIFERALDFALCSTPETIYPYPNGPAVRGVKREFVRHEFLKTYPADSPKAKGVAFGRCAKEAVARRLMVSRDIAPEGTPYFWKLGNSRSEVTREATQATQATPF
ncbi:AAA domain-containing protein [Roseiarcus fermentans]|uniref:AAA domain-containing protein n=1 Tax=Roseiarcus fermentans TaxID=1473586 RepID=A0A366FU57_9HYPH|nr:AAA family ATPase [Roseiarcus fermentans]RBP18158.1 AAA domain-containing protein [Roseiarcus fermentans]